MSYFIIGGQMSWWDKCLIFYSRDKCHGGTNVLFYYRWDKCQSGTNVRVGQMSGGTNVGGTCVGGTKVAPPNRLESSIQYPQLKHNLLLGFISTLFII
jgi:hypothetical protein